MRQASAAMLWKPLVTVLMLSSASASAANATAASITSVPPPYPTFGNIERLGPALNDLLAADATMEKLAEGFNWSEGPIWVQKSGHLLFSDVSENVVYRWHARDGVSVFLRPSGFTGDAYDGREPGSNGLTLDREGRLVLCQHGDRRVARLNPDGKTFTTVAGRYQGGRFNSPNDLCYDRSGNLYFTDPPYGMGPGTVREIEFQGVYRMTPDGTVTLVSSELERPNGLALSPDERTLYVANSHGPRPIIMSFELRGDGKPSPPGVVFFDSTRLVEQGRRGAMDGMKVDQKGNVWATGPGGVLVINAAGKHLGTLLTDRATANCAFAEDGSTLYITADDVLCRIKTRVKGCGF